MASSNTTSKNTYTNNIDQCQYKTELFESQMDLNSIDQKIDSKTVDEQVLSQKMSQLSTTVSKNKIAFRKDIQFRIDQIPNYLTKQNPSFKQMLCQTLSIKNLTSEAHEKIEALRKIAILIYKIMVIQMYQSLWTTYSKSGMGQLINQSQSNLVAYPTNISVWPKEIREVLQLAKELNRTQQDERCLKFVQNHLSEFEDRLQQHRIELNMKTTQFHGYSLTIQKCLENYLEQNLYSLRISIEHQVELVHYDYHIRALKVAYFRQQPNKYQEELMTQVCQSKYEQETSEQEYQFMKQQMVYYNTANQSFQSSPICQSLKIDSIQNPTIQQELFKQFKGIAEQSRTTLFDIYLQSATDQRDEYMKKYSMATQKIRESLYSSNEAENMSSIMAHLIHERCNQIGQRIECIYKFRSQYFLLKSSSS